MPKGSDERVASNRSIFCHLHSPILGDHRRGGVRWRPDARYLRFYQQFEVKSIFRMQSREEEIREWGRGRTDFSMCEGRKGYFKTEKIVIRFLNDEILVHGVYGLLIMIRNTWSSMEQHCPICKDLKCDGSQECTHCNNSSIKSFAPPTFQ